MACLGTSLVTINSIMNAEPKDYAKRSLVIHEQLRGKIGIFNKLPVKAHDDLSIAYTPGVARPYEAIAQDKKAALRLTIIGKGRRRCQRWVCLTWTRKHWSFGRHSSDGRQCHAV